VLVSLPFAIAGSVIVEEEDDDRKAVGLTKECQKDRGGCANGKEEEEGLERKEKKGRQYFRTKIDCRGLD
jgi:hypothetical protein